MKGAGGLKPRPSEPRWLQTRQQPFNLRRQPMITIAGAAAMGVWAERTLAVPWMIWIAIGLLSFWRLAVTTSLIRWAWLLLLIAAALALRTQWDEQRYRAASVLTIIREDPQPALVEAVVASLIQRRPKLGYALRRDQSPWQTQFDVELRAIRDGQRWIPASGRLLVTIDDEAHDLRYGDRLRLAGILSGFGPPTNPGVRDFRLTARNANQHGRLRIDRLSQVEVIAAGGVGLWRLADQVSRAGEATLHACLGPRTGAIAAALVVGRRGAIEQELHDQLLETGTIHLLSVSGLHMGIVAMTLTYLAVLMGLRPATQMVFVGSACLAFVAVTGAKPPVMRAASLVGVVLLARIMGRQNSPLNSLGLAALGLLWINPTNLWQIGVQLSFLAVATLFSCGHRYSGIDEELRAESQLERLVDAARPPWRQRLDRWTAGVGNAAWYSLCVTLSTTPLVWLHFHIVSPVAVLANVLLAIPMTVALISGLIAVVLGAAGPVFAMPMATICYGALWGMQQIIQVATELPGGHFWLPAPPVWWVAFYYLAVIVGFAIPTTAWRQRLFIGGTLLWSAVAAGLAVWPAYRSSSDLQATFIDVGHGTSVIVKLPQQRTLLYDCGWLGNDSYSSRGIQEPLWTLGLTRLDAVAISHADADHYNALPGLLRRFDIGELIVPVGMLDVPKPGLIPIRDAIARAGVPVREVGREDRQLFGDGSVTILHPPRNGVPGTENANSLVLQMEHQGRSLILPGDLEPPGLSLVLELPRPRPGGLLMAPHHGSLSVDSRPVLDWARPREVVVSGGRRAERPEVEETLRARGSGVHITAQDGAIRATFTPDKIEIRRWRVEPW